MVDETGSVCGHRIGTDAAENGGSGFLLGVGIGKGVLLAVFAVLVILGVVTDPTTKGITDSDQALTYTEPKK